MRNNETKYRSVNSCFKTSDKIRACHLLYEDFLQERTDTSKFIFYLWLNKNELGAKRGKDESDFGDGLEYRPG
ncbi:MAG: hypothetical protein OEW87_10050 [Flavobacteriaceae bacterium]|nr:hypothetical protein [Flavobacteriaceae bacterium]